MASIVEFVNKQGRKRWRVHALVDGTMRHPEYRTFEEACHRVYLEEMQRLHGLTPKKFMTMTDFTVNKVIWLYLGGQWAKVKKNQITSATFREAERELGNVHDDIKRVRVANVSQELLLQKVSPGAFIWLRAAFNILVDKGVVAFNPAPKPERRSKEKAEAPPLEEVQRVFDAADTPQLKMFVFLCAVCGLRTGEALAVRREDVKGGNLHVKNHLAPRGIVAGTKRNAGRVLPLPHEFYDLLAKLDGRCVFLVYAPTKPMQSVNIQSFRAHRTLPMYRAAGVTFSNHGLRHFAAATWISEGREVKELQTLLGHDDPNTTLRIYGHFWGLPKVLKTALNLG